MCVVRANWKVVIYAVVRWGVTSCQQPLVTVTTHFTLATLVTTHVTSCQQPLVTVTTHITLATLVITHVTSC